MKTPAREDNDTFIVRVQPATELVVAVCTVCDRERSGVPQWFGGTAQRDTHVHAMRCALRHTCDKGEACPQPEV